MLSCSVCVFLSIFYQTHRLLLLNDCHYFSVTYVAIDLLHAKLMVLCQDKERQKEIVSLLGGMPDERYALLVNLGKKITDYSVDRSLLNDGDYIFIFSTISTNFLPNPISLDYFFTTCFFII